MLLLEVLCVCCHFTEIIIGQRLVILNSYLVAIVSGVGTFSKALTLLCLDEIAG